MNKAAKPISSRNIKIAFALVTSLFFLWGFSYGLVDVMNANFQTQLGVSKAQSGLVQMAYFGAYFIIAIPASMVAGKMGYKGGIIMGLLLYAIGALMIIPASNAHSFNLFLLAFFVLACGLGSLETNANPYITKLGDEKDSSFRLNLAQSFNGLGSFIGPIIGGKLLLSLSHGEASQNMQNIQVIYGGVALVVIVVMVLFFITRMPEGSEVSSEELASEEGEASYGELFRFKHFSFGVVAQFLYVAAQVGAGAFFINYVAERWESLSHDKAAYFLSVALALFLIGRVVTTPLMKKMSPDKLLGIYSTANVILMVVLQFTHGLAAVIALWLVFFFMSISFPTIFSLALHNVPGRLVKKGSSLLVMSIVGGAIAPSIMGALADKFGMGASFLLLLPCFAYVAWYGFSGLSPAHKKQQA